MKRPWRVGSEVWEVNPEVEIPVTVVIDTFFLQRVTGRGRSGRSGTEVEEWKGERVVWQGVTRATISADRGWIGVSWLID